MTVWKYPLPVADDVSIGLPAGARPLSVQVQDGQPCLWALVDPSNPIEPRRFRIAGTGHPLWPDDLDSLIHISTFQLHDGALVFHVFEVRQA